MFKRMVHHTVFVVSLDSLFQPVQLRQARLRTPANRTVPSKGRNARGTVRSSGHDPTMFKSMVNQTVFVTSLHNLY